MTPFLLVSLASATLPDQIGMGARSIGSGGGGVAMVEDGTASFLNPAGLSRIRRPTAAIAGMVGFTQFRDIPDLWWDTNRDGVLDDTDDPLEWSAEPEPMAGWQLQTGRQVGGKFGIGLSAWFPARRLYRLATIEPALPHYVFYDNRSQRYVLTAGLGGEIVKGLNVGASVDFYPKAKFDLYGTIDLTVSSPDNPDNGTIDDLVTEVGIDVHDLVLDLKYAALPIFGVQLEFGRWSNKLDGLVVGATFRPPVNVAIDADLDVQANVALSDIGDLEPFLLGSTATANALLYDHYLPTRVGLGAAWRTDDVFSAYLDATWEDWRRGRLQVSQVESATIVAPLFRIDDAFSDRNAYTVVMASTWSFRTGLELRLPEVSLENRLRYLRLTARGGFAYLPTPLRAQGPESAFLDADRITLALGAGVEFHDPFDLVDAPVRLDLFGQLNTLSSTTLPHQADVPTLGFPRNSSGIPIGGQLVVIGAQWGFDY
jgi:hypothetical protein